jgi:hypothetical protein
MKAFDRLRAWPHWPLILAVLAIKALIAVAGIASYEIHADQSLQGPADVLGIWNRWDSLHYLFIAEHGYLPRPVLLPFFPLYPALIRLGAAFVGSYLGSAFVVSTLASLVLAVLFARLAVLDLDAPLAERAVLFLFIFPTSYFLHIGYTESLFLALAVGSILSARRGLWLWAGVCGALAALTRVNAIVLVPVLAYEAWAEYRTRRRFNWEWLAIGAVLAGLAAYLVLNWAVAGDPFAFLTFQREHWHRTLAWPHQGVRAAWEIALWRHPAEAQMVGTQELIFIGLGLAATLASCLRDRGSYGIWMAGNWLLFVCQPHIYAVPRYTLILFPIYLLFARLSQSRLTAAVIATWSLLFLGLFLGEFIQGRWAF